MKRILVIDESEVIRETLALILGREFSVIKKMLGTSAVSLAESGADVDLLILGVNPTLHSDAGRLSKFAARVPCAVLFLVDSRSAIKLIEERETVGCLAKPFNPYELKRKVGTLLARTAALPEVKPAVSISTNPSFGRYLAFPFISRTAATLVHRFAVTRLPILVSGEIGCGQERVIRGMCAVAGNAGPCVFVNAAEIDDSYVAERHSRLPWERGQAAGTVVVEDIDKLSASKQSTLLNLMDELEALSGNLRFLATSKSDLLERVYQGDFIEGLYYRLATLTLKLPSLRERRAEIPAIAEWFARSYAGMLGLGEVTFSVDARERLSHYLWFGNLAEIESVIARTLAVRRKTKIDATDLLFDFSAEPELPETSDDEQVFAFRESELELAGFTSPSAPPRQSAAPTPTRVNANGKSADLKLLIHELAHEMKNPMVTIKTFAQLLGDRYEDENFRGRFQDVVGGDIQRMDDLLELMIDFTEFSQPDANPVSPNDFLRAVLQEVGGECAKRQASVRWETSESSKSIVADEDQLAFILKNVLLTVFSQTKMGSEVYIEQGEQGRIVISYLREGAAMASISQHLGEVGEGTGDNVLPLRMLLAKQLVERNGGRMIIDASDGEREILRMEFPIA